MSDKRKRSPKVRHRQPPPVEMTPAGNRKITSEEMGEFIQLVDKYGDKEGKRYAHEEWERPGYSYQDDDGKWLPPQQYQMMDDLLAPHPPRGKKPIPGIDIEPRGFKAGKTGGFDIWGPGGMSPKRLPEPENKPGQRYPDKWKPGGTQANLQTPGAIGDFTLFVTTTVKMG